MFPKKNTHTSEMRSRGAYRPRRSRRRPSRAGSRRRPSRVRSQRTHRSRRRGLRYRANDADVSDAVPTGSAADGVSEEDVPTGGAADGVSEKGVSTGGDESKQDASTGGDESRQGDLVDKLSGTWIEDVKSRDMDLNGLSVVVKYVLTHLNRNIWPISSKAEQLMKTTLEKEQSLTLTKNGDRHVTLKENDNNEYTLEVQSAIDTPETRSIQLAQALKLSVKTYTELKAVTHTSMKIIVVPKKCVDEEECFQVVHRDFSVDEDDKLRVTVRMIFDGTIEPFTYTRVFTRAP